MSAKTLDGWTSGTGSRTGTGAATVESEREREIGTRIRAGSLDGLVFGNFYLYSGYCLVSHVSAISKQLINSRRALSLSLPLVCHSAS